jgi:thioredoxin
MNKFFFWFFFPATLLAFSSCAQMPPALQLDASSFAAMIDSVTDEWIIDVRTRQEFESGHIANAINLDYYADDFMQQLANLPKDKPLLVYCLSGSRSNAAAEQLKSMGYARIYHLAGGIQSWKQANLPVQGESRRQDSFTESDYRKLITSHNLLMIDFYAPWCLPCRKMKPWIVNLQKEFAGKVHIEQINADEAEALCRSLNISALPVLVFIADGKEVTRLTGLQSEETMRSKLEELMRR